MKLRNILPLILLFTSLGAAASIDERSCSDVDIKDRHPTLEEHFSTPRNQGSIGWCFAFAAADLLSVETGVPVSSFHVAAVYNAETFNNFIFNFFRENLGDETQKIYESGWLSRAVRKVSQRGTICTEESMPFNSNRRETNSFLMRLDSLSERSKQDNLSLQDTAERLDRILPPHFRGINVMRAARSLKNDNINVTIEKITSEQCREEKIKVPDVKTTMLTYWTHGEERYYKKLNGALNRGRPVAIRYNSGLYTKKRTDSSHVSVITARRWKNGKCQYKIRNSWGKSCSSYRSGIECLKSEGAFWIDASDLVRHRFSSYYLSKRKQLQLPYVLE